MTSAPALLQSHRPLFFRALNAAGALLLKAGFLKLPINEAQLLETARRQTGLSDFGDDNFREPLRRLIDAINREARPNLMGRLAARQEILQLLINRLHIQRDRKAHPGITAQPIAAPIFIIGLPRTGTTLLHSLLACDPENRAPLTWEVMYPSPPDNTDVKQRLARAKNNMAWLDRMVPDFKKIHLAGAELPQECVAIMSHLFMSDEFETLFHIPSYRDWFEAQDAHPAYAWHRAFLQHLQHRAPGHACTWVLKAPFHLVSLDALLATYPDARIVQTHREPLDVIASTASLTTVLRSAFSDHVDPALIGGEMAEFWARALDAFAAVRDTCPAAQFLDLDFADITRDPIAAAQRVYTHFHLPFTPQAESAMRAFMEQNPKDKHGAHRYTLEQFAIDPATASPRFASYRRRFNIPDPKLN